MQQYGQYCPVARALEVVGDRWSLLILREMLAGSSHFNEIERGLPGISRAVLSQRLRMLEDGGVVRRKRGDAASGRGYELTAAGRELRPVVDSLHEWGARWAFDDPRPAELDPAWLLTSLARSIRPGAIPAKRVVVEFRFKGGRRPYVWLLLNPGEEPDVCLKHPGFETDLIVDADTDAFFRICFGRMSQREAESRGSIRCDGNTALWQAFPSWFDRPALPASARRAGAAAPALS